MPTITRADYLAGKATHREYYAQFVDVRTIARVESAIGGERILASKDRSYNDIPLREWDIVALGALPVAGDIKAAGDYWTLAGLVCTAKEAARQWVESRAPRWEVRRDGETKATYATANQAFAGLLGLQGQSVDWATTHEGWAIVEVQE